MPESLALLGRGGRGGEAKSKEQFRTSDFPSRASVRVGKLVLQSNYEGRSLKLLIVRLAWWGRGGGLMIHLGFALLFNGIRKQNGTLMCSPRNIFTRSTIRNFLTRFFF